MNKILYLLVVSFSFTNLLSQDTVQHPTYGLNIIFSNKGQIFPKDWTNEKINGKAIPIQNIEKKRSLKIINKALLKYPKQLIEENLSSIFVFGYLEFFGQPYGGTNSNHNIYITNKGNLKGSSEQYIEQLIHAEFSSILFRNFKHLFDKKEWRKLNPIDFSYGKGGVEAIRKGKANERFNTSINRKGFINQYATSSLENDFNSFAKNLFSPKNGFEELYTNYNIIKSKRAFVIDFYNKIDESFNERYFRKLEFKK